MNDKKNNNNKKFLYLSFFLTLVFGWFFLYSFLPEKSTAATANVSGTVAEEDNDCVPGTNVCGEWNTTNCNTTGEKTRSCNDGCTTTTETGICGGGNPPPPPPPPPICGTYSCSYGECINDSRTVVCGDLCSSTTTQEACTVGVCGDGALNSGSGEECDDGNTASGDGCSSSCKLEFGCGNGTVDAGEQCDDNNLTGGDCCSSSCQLELNISSSVGLVTQTSGQINWNTSCQMTSSVLEWGTTVAVADGSVGGLSGQNYSYNITGLNLATTYFYRITATAGSLQNISTGSFVTSGAVEICNNGVDDDNDGFCDYPASTCTDGSVPGDADCSCTPDFICTPTAACDPNTLLEPINCVDQNNCQPDYDATQSCGCPGVVPGVCQEVDPTTCSLITLSNCCGNSLCEPPTEGPVSCAVDCPVSCISDWTCTAWSPEPCPASGIQTRNCFDNNACTIPINPPDVTQTCGGICPGLSCGWGQILNTTNCTCEDIIPFCGNGVCETGEDFSSCSADCIELCTPNWTCTAWGECASGQQQRVCEDLNNCGLNINKPPEVKACTADCSIACGTCQLLDLNACACLNTAFCCGNRSCENGETNWSCPVDCAIPPTFTITLSTCLDGIDNDGDGFTDYPLDSGCRSASDSSEQNLQEIAQNILNILEDPRVQETNEKIAAPAIISLATASAFTSFSFFNLLSYLRYIFTQPFALFGRRQRKKYGVVYNALTKKPIDLAIVRLYKKENNQLIQSKVTDKDGRYSFLVEPGSYYMTVTKPRFDFPTNYLKDKKEDVKFLDLYHGESVTVTDSGAVITANIPLDPQIQEKPVRQVVVQHYLRKIQYAISFSAVPLAAISVIISPSVFTLVLLGFHILLYILFRRLGYQKPPKSWGIIYDKDNKKPVGRAVTRIYDKQYNKLLETRVTDAKGRYSFLVNDNIYYVTVEKLGYKEFKTEDIDLVNKSGEGVISKDIALDKAQTTVAAKSALATPKPVQVVPPPGKIGVPQALPPKPPAISPQPPKTEAEISGGSGIKDIKDKIDKLEVDRASLEELIADKKEIQEIRQDISEQKEDLTELEKTVDDVEKNIEQKLSSAGESGGASKKTIAEQLQEIKNDKGLSDEAAGSSEIKQQTTPQDKKDLPPEKSIFG